MLFLSITTSEPDSPPEDVTVEDISPSTATLTWSPPEKANGVIQHYEVLYENESFSATVITSLNRITLTSLRPFSNYNVSVRAYTRFGHGNQTSDTLYLLSGEDGALLDTNTLISTYCILKLKYQQGHLVSSLQFQAVLHMVSVLSLSVPARWTWPGSRLYFQTGSSFTTVWSFGILLTTWISHHRRITFTSHIWGSTRTTESWCKLTHASALETTAVSHSTSLRWRMVRRMIEGKGERAGFPFIFSRSLMTSGFSCHLFHLIMALRIR